MYTSKVLRTSFIGNSVSWRVATKRLLANIVTSTISKQLYASSPSVPTIWLRMSLKIPPLIVLAISISFIGVEILSQTLPHGLQRHRRLSLQRTRRLRNLMRLQTHLRLIIFHLRSIHALHGRWRQGCQLCFQLRDL